MELLLKLKAAGFYTYGLGVETFADRLLKSPSVNKLGVDAQDCENVLDAMLDIGLNPLIQHYFVCSRIHGGRIDPYD